MWLGSEKSHRKHALIDHFGTVCGIEFGVLYRSLGEADVNLRAARSVLPSQVPDEDVEESQDIIKQQWVGSGP